MWVYHTVTVCMFGVGRVLDCAGSGFVGKQCPLIHVRKLYVYAWKTVGDLYAFTGGQKDTKSKRIRRRAMTVFKWL